MGQYTMVPFIRFFLPGIFYRACMDLVSKGGCFFSIVSPAETGCQPQRRSLAVMNVVASDRASSSHPAKNDRLAAITKGWIAAKTEIPGNTSGNTNLSPINDPNRIRLAIQSTKTLTGMLSNDGKTCQPAELKAGEPFLFRFEIYNYSWLKLSYYNGSEPLS